MPRPRKYDPEKDLPVTLFIRVPIGLLNDAEKAEISRKDIEKEIVNDRLVEKFIKRMIKNRKKG